MKIAICDDEQICLDDINKHLDIFANENNTKFDKYIFTCAEDALAKSEKFDIAILDVEMSGTDGIKLGERLREINPHIVLIYITAHRKYLDDALNLNAVRFFEKPIDAERFYRGLRDSIKRIDTDTVEFFLKDAKTLKKINKQDIIYIEIQKRKTLIVTTGGNFSTDMNINEWSKLLTSEIFVSPHKSYIINLNFVTAYERRFVILGEETEIPIARSRQQDFKDVFFKYIEGK